MSSRIEHFWLVVEATPGAGEMRVVGGPHSSRMDATDAAQSHASVAWERGAVFVVLESTKAYKGVEPKTKEVWLIYPSVPATEPEPVFIPAPEAAPAAQKKVVF